MRVQNELRKKLSDREVATLYSNRATSHVTNAAAS